MHLDLMRDARLGFPAVENPDQVTSLRVWHCKYKNMRELLNFTNIIQLVIGTFPDDSFDFLAYMSQLKTLKVVHLPNISTLAQLRLSSSIESLSLATLPTWDASGKVTEVDSLVPLAEMSSLRHLELFGVRPAYKSLAELEKSSCLQTAQFSKYPKSEVERFHSSTGVKNIANPKIIFSA